MNICWCGWILLVQCVEVLEQIVFELEQDRRVCLGSTVLGDHDKGGLPLFEVRVAQSAVRGVGRDRHLQWPGAVRCRSRLLYFLATPRRQARERRRRAGLNSCSDK